MSSALVSMFGVMCVLAGDGFSPTVGSRYTYQGEVSLVDRNRDQANAQPGKTFDLVCLITSAGDAPAQGFWLVDERGQGGWSWSERFGRLALTADGEFTASTGPSLLYDYGQGRSIVPLPSPFWLRERELAENVSWNEGKWEYAVDGAPQRDGRPTWRLTVTGPFGKRRTLWIDQQQGHAVAIDERVFMDQGTEYQLRMRLVGIEPTESAEFAELRAGFGALMAARNRLQRPARSVSPDLTSAQLEIVETQMPRLTRFAETPLVGGVVRAAGADADAQTQRQVALEDVATRLVGQPLPLFQADALSGESYTNTDLANQVTVLHFWDYRGEPLEEPYGQVGYIEFLYNRHKKAGVRVLGVAVDNRLNNEASRKPALAGIRKLRTFMNLSYPILLDDGAWIGKLGDPRVVGSELPLVVVVGRDGTVLHYHAGAYRVDRRDGLKALDQVVVEALQP